MTTTAQQIMDRAVARNTANRLSSLTDDTTQILWRIGTEEQSIFARLAGENRTYYQTSTSVASNAAASGRVVSLSAVSPPVLRVLRVEKSDGTEVYPVDLRDTDAELAPRYYPRGLSLVEVGSDWASNSSAVTLTIYYVQGATALSTTGALTQTVTIPDAFADLLDNRLARWLAEKDVGRDPAEIAMLDQEYAKRYDEFVVYLDNLAGTQTTRFILAEPESKA